MKKQKSPSERLGYIYISPHGKHLPMVGGKDHLSKIESLLKQKPKGLTTSEISQILKLNRNSAAKYLEILTSTGRIEMNKVGAARVYTYSHRIPSSVLLNYSSDYIIVFDDTLKIIRANNSFLKFFNLKRESIEGKHLDGVQSEMLQGLTELDIFKTARISEKKACSDLSYTISGEKKYFKIKCLPILFDNGKNGVTVLIEDLTLQKNYEHKLIENEAQDHAIVEDQTDLICRRLPDGTVTFVNDAFCRYFGKIRENLVGTKFYPKTPHQNNNSMPDAFGADIKPHYSNTYEQQVLPEIGKVRWIQWNNRTLCDESGNITEIQSVGRDITAQREREIEILMNNCDIAFSTYPILIWDCLGRIVYANRAFILLFGYEHEIEIIGGPVDQFLPMMIAEINYNQINDSLFSKGYFDGITNAVKKDGSSFKTNFYSIIVNNDIYMPQVGGIGIFLEVHKNPPLDIDEQIGDSKLKQGYSIKGIAIVDPSGIITYVDQNILDMAGCSDESLVLGEQIISILVPTGSQGTDFSEFMKDGGRTGEWRGEGDIKYPDVPSVPVVISVKKIKNNDGTILCSHISVESCDGPNEVKISGIAPNPGLTEFFESMNIPSFIINCNKQVFLWNHAMEVFTGMKKEEILGTTDYGKALSVSPELSPLLIDAIELPPDDLKTLCPGVQQFGIVFYLERKIPSFQNNQGTYIFEKASRIIDPDGNFIGFIESIQDIGEIKHVQESLMKMKGEIDLSLKEKLEPVYKRIKQDYPDMVV